MEKVPLALHLSQIQLPDKKAILNTGINEPRTHDRVNQRIP